MKKKIRFLIIGSDKSKNNLDLLREIRKTGNYGRIISQSSLLFAFDGKMKSFSVLRKKTNLDGYDIFIFRGYNENRVEAQMIAERMLFLGKVVIDEIIGKNFIVGKMYEASEFAENGVDHISTFEVMNFSDAKRIVKRMKIPFILKQNDSRKGRGIYRFEDKDEALEFISQNKGRYLIQEYIPIDCDYRVMVVGGKAIGAFKRYVPEGDFRTNRHGVRTEKIQMPKKMASIAEKATRAMNYDVAGVDILEQDGKYKIIEVNIAPEWQRFKDVLGTNPAESIIKLGIKRFRSNRKLSFRIRSLAVRVARLTFGIG